MVIELTLKLWPITFGRSDIHVLKAVDGLRRLSYHSKKKYSRLGIIFNEGKMIDFFLLAGEPVDRFPFPTRKS
jgi:hypothetical protein